MGLYSLLPTASYLSGSSMNIANRKREMVSSCSVPLCMGMVGIFPRGVI